MADKKVIDTYSIYPDRKSWVEQQAISQTGRQGRRVSKSEIIDNLIAEAMEQDYRGMKLLLKKTLNGRKSIKTLKAENKHEH